VINLPAGSTYEPIATTTLTGGTSYTFSSIPSTYTDLVLVANVAITSGSSNINMDYNGVTSSQYSFVRVRGDGTSALSSQVANLTTNYIGDISTTFSTNIIQIQNYANTSVYKTTLSRSNDTTSNVQAWATLWRNTAAINSIKVYPSGLQTFTNGSMLTLYGITAA
jgi:hypothetical protein